jgi:hypothetical protein
MRRSKEEEEARLTARQPYVILDVGGEKFTVLRNLEILYAENDGVAASIHLGTIFG